MTKKQCKNKIARLEGRIDEMQEQVIHYKRQAKVLDAEDSKKLLEKFHIESEELEELLMNRGRKEAAELQEPALKKSIHRKAEAKSEQEQASAEATEEPDQPIAEPESNPEQAQPEQEPQPVQESHTSMMDAFRKEAEQ